jgi:hypothetical protein
MSKFFEAWSSRQPQLDAVFAETISLVPTRPGGYAEGAPDPDRAERQVLAIITERPDRMRTVQNAVGRDFDRAIVMADTIASIDTTRLGGEWPKVGDRVILLDRPDQPAFEITVVESDGLVRVLLSLIRITT